MANVLPVNSVIAKKSLSILRNKLPMAMMANKDYQEDISDQQARVGGQIFVRRPPRYQGRDGELMQVESTVMTTVPMTLKMSGVDVSFSQKDLQLSLDDIARGGLDYALEPAMTSIAAKIETAGASLFNQAYTSVGTPGTVPTDPSIMYNANAYIDSLGGTIGGDKVAVLDGFASASLARNVNNLFNPQKQISQAYLKGYIGDIGGFDTFVDPAVQSFTAGVYGGTPVVNGAGQTGPSLVTNGWTATTTSLNVGDTFTIANVFSVNPQTRQSTGKLQFFVVMAQTVTDGSGNSTISISPAITPSGQFQNVTAAPANSAAITVTSGASGTTSRQSLLFDKNAITFACVPQAKPMGNNFEYSRSTDKMSGLAMSMITQYDAKTNQVATRFDVLYAWLMSYPELVVRLQG
jgi:hypothetical protein